MAEYVLFNMNWERANRIQRIAKRPFEAFREVGCFEFDLTQHAQ